MCEALSCSWVGARRRSRPTYILIHNSKYIYTHIQRVRGRWRRSSIRPPHIQHHEDTCIYITYTAVGSHTHKKKQDHVLHTHTYTESMRPLDLAVQGHGIFFVQQHLWRQERACCRELLGCPGLSAQQILHLLRSVSTVAFVPVKQVN